MARPSATTELKSIRVRTGEERQMRCEKTLEIVPGASHLFEEPGTLEQVARLAGDWFVRQFRAVDRHRFSQSTTTGATPD